MEQEYTYWMALAHTERMRTAQKNEIIVQCYERSIGLSDFFHCGEAVWQKDFQLTPEEIGWLNESKKGLPNYAFEAESLLEQGYSVVLASGVCPVTALPLHGDRRLPERQTALGAADYR